MKKIRNVLIGICAALLFAFAGTGGAHAAVSVTVWCPGYNCASGSTYEDWCESSYKWCSVQVGSNSTYKYCVPRFGYYDSYTGTSHSYASAGIVCYSDYSICNAIRSQTVPWTWDGSSSYMNPQPGYFATGCSTTATYSATDTNPYDIYTAAPGYYIQSRYPMISYSDSSSWIEDKVDQCASGTYSLGATRSCTTCPSNATCTTTPRSNFKCNSGYYGTDPNAAAGTYGLTPSGSCTACPTADSGWAKTGPAGATTWSSCYERQTPTGCYDGYVKRMASSASAYSSTITLGSTLEADMGYYTTSSSATSCTKCPQLYGVDAETDDTGSTSPTACYIEDGLSITDTYGTFEFDSWCYYCQNMCSTQSECRALNYNTCSNGCCTGYCASGVFGTSQSTCALAGYPVYTSSNNCCSGSCGTSGTVCSTVTQCRNAGYNNSATCSSGCCSGSKCTAAYGASGNTTGRCTSNLDCATDTSSYDFSCNTTTGCCERTAISSCTHGTCEDDGDCDDLTYDTCNVLTGCCERSFTPTLCKGSGDYCDTNNGIYCQASVGCNCYCVNNSCRCTQVLN